MCASVYTYSLSTTWYSGLQLAGALFRIEPKLVRAQTYPDGVFLVRQEIIRRILDIPLCKYPLGNRNPHIEEQSHIYIKRIPARQKFHSITSTFLQGVYVYSQLSPRRTPLPFGAGTIKNQIKRIS